MSGTIKLKTERLLLRRHQSEDALILYDIFGSDPKMFEYSGWNPYRTRAMAKETVESFIKNYDDPRFYGWGIEYEGRLIGTIGAYDYDADKNRIEAGISIERASWGRGFAAEDILHLGRECSVAIALDELQLLVDDGAVEAVVALCGGYVARLSAEFAQCSLVAG